MCIRDRRITRHFPRVINDLRLKLEEADGLFDQPFLHKGRPLSEAIDIQQQEIEAKYPRCRVRMQRSKKGTSKVCKENKVTKKSFKDTQSSIRAPISLYLSDFNMTHKTPSKSSAKNLPKNGTSRENSLTRHMQGTTRLSSPKRRDTRLLPPTVISRNSKRNIETHTLNKDRPSDFSSSPMLNYTQSGYPVKPRQLFPIPLNKVGTKGSHIPQLNKEKALELVKRSASSIDKENIRSPERKSTLEHYTQKLNSPYKAVSYTHLDVYKRQILYTR